MNRRAITAVVVLISILFLGWGSVGHRIINKNISLSLHPQMSFLSFWSDSLAVHGSDADTRKSWDLNEKWKHYIDIDSYPEFVNTGRISQSFDSVVTLHGYDWVIDVGILPWTIIAYVDSLKNNFQLRNWNRAMLVAADLGHYIGDEHMPLHITKNYDGQYTGQSGVHSRYETTLIGKYYSEIIYTGDSAIYISSVSDFVFNFIYQNYAYVDSILAYDIVAKTYSGGSYNNSYYAKLWEKSKSFTINLYKNASYFLSCLIYTAWINAGRPTLTSSEKDFANELSGFTLEQNYPNPFNPVTRIKYSISKTNHVVLKIFDILGKEVATLVDEEKASGTYEVEFVAGNYIANGVYYYQLKAGEYCITKKMILMK